MRTVENALVEMPPPRALKVILAFLPHIFRATAREHATSSGRRLRIISKKYMVGKTKAKLSVFPEVLEAAALGSNALDNLLMVNVFKNYEGPWEAS